ncbi:hypothetical protein [Holdemanella biformis]|uniref:hypothetical protein n=1 Tax=Holdemanella biformis TaxID=1735 RepID=UPI003562CECD
MNDFFVNTRRRGRSLLIVEGKHEKNQLFWLKFKCFPELNIDFDDVWIYGTNIYKLYDDIQKEYGENWVDDDLDIDLPLVISKKENFDTKSYRNEFTNIILVFDYERHDPSFSETKILKMQEIFMDSTDMGKLYLNYPMIESYLHFKEKADEQFVDRKISTTLQPGSKYKNMVKKESYIMDAIKLPHKIDNLLEERYHINKQKRIECCESILSLKSNEMKDKLDKILEIVGDVKQGKTLKFLLIDWVSKLNYFNDNMSYWEYMRAVFRDIVYYNIKKAGKIQHVDNTVNDLREQFDCIDLTEILKNQNGVSKDEINGFIWVLSTCVFLIPDYNFNLLQ